MTMQENSDQQQQQQHKNLNNDDKDFNDLPVALKTKLEDLISKIDQIENTVNQYESKSLKEVTSKLSPLDSAKFNWINLFAINSLFFSFLKCSGQPTKDHPIMNELNRTRNYMLRINEIVKKEEDKQKSRLKLDKDSAARTIKRATWQYVQKKYNSDSLNNSITTAATTADADDDEPQIKRLKSDD